MFVRTSWGNVEPRHVHDLLLKTIGQWLPVPTWGRLGGFEKIRVVLDYCFVGMNYYVTILAQAELDMLARRYHIKLLRSFICVFVI